MAVNEVHHFSH